MKEKLLKLHHGKEKTKEFAWNVLSKMSYSYTTIMLQDIKNITEELIFNIGTI